MRPSAQILPHSVSHPAPMRLSLQKKGGLMRLIASLVLGVLAVLPIAALAQVADGTIPAVQALSEEDAAEQPSLADLRWIARPLVVFADTPNDPRFSQQIEMLAERESELLDRDVVVLTDTDPAARGPLRTELRPRDFGLVLIDKDGSVVQRRPAPTTAREIINLIDRLPSRRQEIGSQRP
jgi:hypothetical protein